MKFDIFNEAPDENEEDERFFLQKRRKNPAGRSTSMGLNPIDPNETFPPSILVQSSSLSRRPHERHEGIALKISVHQPQS